MPYSLEKDIEQSKALATFLKTSFKGSSVNGLSMDDATASLERVIRISECINDLDNKAAERTKEAADRLFDKAPGRSVVRTNDLRTAVEIVTVFVGALAAVFVGGEVVRIMIR